MTIHNAVDNSFKLIFADHKLFSEFIRDFINIDILKNISPDDIEDVSERYIPLTGNSRDSDTVKRIKLNGKTPFFVIAVLEHESQVNFRASFKIFQYIYLVLDAWEKEAEKEDPGVSLRKDFKYPPVLPIVFYDGKSSWTAERNFFNRTHLNSDFEKYIPKFEYELVNLNDYNEEEIMKFGNALSFILLVDKLRDSKGKSMLTHLPADYVEKLRLQIPEYLSKLLIKVTYSLLSKSEFKRPEAEQVVSGLKKAEHREYDDMFEALLESMREAQQEAWEEGHEEGIEIGIEQGREEEREKGEKKLQQDKLNTAFNLKNMGVSIEIIAKSTGLSPEEIEKANGD